jgi:outer membrane protein OmpA-like peptidoglycan-associated protein
MTAFDNAKALRWRESLQPYLRRPELSPAFDAARRVETKWAEVVTPAGRYGDELITAIIGELELTIIIPLPPIPPKPPEPPAPEKVAEALSPTSGFLGVLTAIATLGASVVASEVTKTVTQGARATAEALYNEVGPEAQYARFQRDVMPGVAVGFANELELWYRGAGGNLVQLTGIDCTLVSDYQPGRPLLVSVRGTVNNQVKRSDISQLVITSKKGLPAGCRVLLNTASLRYQTSSFEHAFVTDWRVNDDIELQTPTVTIDDTTKAITVTFPGTGDGATLYTPIDTWEQKNPRKEDERLAGELVDHLNDGLEYYHNAIWWTMDANRRYMLLDGFIAPRSGGRSVASVVENRLLGIAGNSLIMPVARGVHLDPRIKPSKPEETLDLARYYAPSTPIPPARISLPTRGVFAEAVMGACNACEHMDDTRFWRWEEHPLEELPALPSLESRRADLSTTTGPSALPTPVVSIQNAPEAPDPAGLAALINLLGQQTFRDITGLAGNQQNAAAAYKQALETATEFGKEASKLTQQAAMLKSLDKAMSSIDKAEAEKKIKPEEAQKLRNSALEKVTGGTDGALKASDVTERLNVIKKAVADGDIDEKAAKGFSQSVLRSYVEGADEPPAERAAAARLIEELPRESVTSVETAETSVQTAADRVERASDAPTLDRLEREFADTYPGLISKLEGAPGTPTAFALWNFGVNDSNLRRFDIALDDFGSVFTNLRDRGYNVDIVGSASVSGSAAHNMDVAFARALAVSNLYQDRFDMPLGRINVRQVGELVDPPPPDVFLHFPNEEATWRAWNRRVEVHPVALQQWSDSKFEDLATFLGTAPASIVRSTRERNRAIGLAKLLKKDDTDDLFIWSFQALVTNVQLLQGRAPLYDRWLVDPTRWDRFTFAGHMREELAKLAEPSGTDELLAKQLVAMLRAMDNASDDLNAWIKSQEEGGFGAAINVVYRTAKAWIARQIENEASVYSVFKE